MGRPPIGVAAMSSAERMRKYRDRLRQEHPKPPDDRQRLAEAQQEIARLRQHIHALERATKPRLAQPKAPKAAPTESEAVARLKRMVRNLRSELATVRDWYEKRRPDLMPFGTYSALVKCLHPDKSPPTPEQRTSAFALLSQWKQSQRGQAQ